MRCERGREESWEDRASRQRPQALEGQTDGGPLWVMASPGHGQKRGLGGEEQRQ